jgi:CHAD domain-containing protein
VIAQAAVLERIGHALPAGLAQVARFDGRASVLPIEHDGARLVIEVLEGTVGWGRRKRPACRVTLTGDEAAIQTLAVTLAEPVHLAVPTASLAAEARAVATGVAPTPRHRGAPALPAGLTVAAAFGCVLGQLADIILYNAPLAAGGRNGPDPVHEMRVAVRRLRSAMALFRPAVGCPAVDAGSAGLKALADRLAPARDWDVFVAETAVTVAEALPDDASLRRLRAAAERRRRQAYAALRDWIDSPEFRRLGITLASLAGGSAWKATLDQTQQETLARDLEHFASHALARRLRRLTAAGEAIEQLDADALHAIRLRAKRMRYAAEVLAPLYPGKSTRRFLRRLMQLQDRLGHLNDGSVANMLLTQLGTVSGPRAHAAGLVRGFLAARNSDTRSHIARAWNRFHRLDPFWR